MQMPVIQNGDSLDENSVEDPDVILRNTQLNRQGSDASNSSLVMAPPMSNMLPPVSNTLAR